MRTPNKAKESITSDDYEMGESSDNANADDLESDTEDLGFPNLNVNDWLLVIYI